MSTQQPTEDGATVSLVSGPGVSGAAAPPGERVVYAGKPSVLFVVLWPLGLLVSLLAGAAGFWYVGSFAVWPELWTGTGLTLLVAALLVVGWAAAEWRVREYVLTDRRVSWRSGVLRRLYVECPLRDVRAAVVYRSIRERLFGLGTLGFGTAGTGGIEVVWAYVAGPEAAYAAVRREIDIARGAAAASIAPTPGPITAAVEPVEPVAAPEARGVRGEPRIPVIGLAGGIGAGKSEVGRAFARLGCVVIDSDANAKAALDRPEVRDRLVAWWGADVLGPEGRVDRGRVAAIVFADPEQRRRLEALVHPIVRQDRAGAIAAARAQGAAAAVIDAPLLFEAGVDRECDVVVFVDAPIEQRLARVRERRGWPDGELPKREAAQMPLEEKRRRSRFVLNNAGPMADLEKGVADLLARILTEVGGSGAARPDPRDAGPTEPR